MRKHLTSTASFIALATTLTLAPAVGDAAPPVSNKKTANVPKITLVTTIEADTPGLDNVHNWGSDLVVKYTQTGNFDFRARTNVSMAKSLRWEVSLAGFDGAEGVGPVQVLDSGTVALKGKVNDWQWFSISFGKHAPAAPTAAKPAIKTIPKSALNKSTSTATTKTTPSSLYDTPRVYWVRVTPLDANGKPLGETSEPVRVIHRPAPPQGKWYGNDAMQVVPHLGIEAKILRYEPIHDATSDAWKRWVVTRCSDAPTAPFQCSKMPVGTQFYMDPTAKGDKNVIQIIGGAIEDGLEFLADAVNWASEAYADIKKFAVSSAAAIIPGCGADCQSVLATALDVGLAALGLPPSLPNFDDLLKYGEDYLVEFLADAIAKEFPMLPKDLVEDGARKLLDEARKKVSEAAAHGPKGDKWYKPDPAYQYRDAMVYVEVTNTEKKALGGSVYLTFLADGTWLFQSKYIPVPELAPGQKVEIPVTLTPDKRSWFERRVRENNGTAYGGYGDAWREAYNSKTVELGASGVTSSTVKCKATKQCKW